MRARTAGAAGDAGEAGAADATGAASRAGAFLEGVALAKRPWSIATLFPRCQIGVACFGLFVTSALMRAHAAEPCCFATAPPRAPNVQSGFLVTKSTANATAASNKEALAEMVGAALELLGDCTGAATAVSASPVRSRSHLPESSI